MSLKVDDPRYGSHYAMTLRLKPHIGELLEKVSGKLGTSKTAVLVAALHDYAKKHEVSQPPVTVSVEIDPRCKYRPV